MSDTDEFFDRLADSEPVTSDDEDSVDASLDQDEAEDLRRAAGTDGVDVQTELPERRRQGGTDEQSPAHPEPEPADVEDVLLEPATHELNGFLAWDGAGLSPFFAVASAFEPDMSEEYGSFEFDGESWAFVDEKCRYWQSGIAGRDEDDFERFYEYQIKVRAVDDLGERDATFQIRPGLPDARKSDGSRVKSLPEDLPECIRIQVESSNVDDEELIPLLQSMADHIDVNPSYFEPYQEDVDVDDQPIYPPSCNISGYARYTRNFRPMNEGRVTGFGGVLERLQRFSTAHGGKGIRKWDNEEIEGQMNTVTLSAGDWEKLVPGQTLGKRIKSYHPEHPRSEATFENPLSNPKTEVQFSPKYSEERSVPWLERHELKRELDEALLNILSWAGLPVTPEPEVYVEDAYFAVDGREREFDILQNPTPALEEVETSLATAHYHRGDLGPKEFDVLEALTDGGDHQHYEELPASSSTVYRLADKLGDVIEVVNGKLSLQDGIIRDQFERLFETVERTVEWADRSLRELAEDEQDFEADLGPLGQWARSHGATIAVDHRDGVFDVELVTGEWSRYELQKILRAGVDAARRSGAEAYRMFRYGWFSWTEPGGERKTDQKPINRRGAVLRP